MISCIYSSITFSLLICLVTCKPKWVHEVESCPMANNLTDWNRASKALRCAHDLTSKDSSEQFHVYHCMPSSYMNETVEFCGKSVPVEKGNCPVYTYKYGDNEAPNAKSCKTFSSGCPKQLYYSKTAYMYSECLNINKKCRCYRADPTCSEECSEKGFDTSSRNIIEITTFTMNSEIDFDTPSRNTTEITTYSTKIPPDPESENKDFKLVTYPIIIITATTWILLLITVSYYLLRKKRILSNLSNNDHRYNIVKWSGNNDTVELEEDDDLIHFPLHNLLCSIGKGLSNKSIQIFTFHLNAQKKNTTHQRINALSTGSDVLLQLHKIYDFSLNFFLLEAFLDMANEQRLKRRCMEFAKNNNKIYYSKGNVCKRGYRELVLHLNGSIETFSTSRIEEMRKQLSVLMQMEDPEDILLSEVSKGSVLVHFLIKKKYLGVVRDCNFSVLKKYGLKEIMLMGERIYAQENTEEEIDQSSSPLLAQEKEQENRIYISKVFFEFGPKELTAHKRVAEEMKVLCKLIGKQKSPDDSVFIIHSTEKDREEICFALFESAPHVVNFEELKNLDAEFNFKGIIICCVGKRPFNVATVRLLQDLHSNENLFVYIMEKEHEIFEQTVLDISSTIGGTVKSSQILHSKSDKQHLYRSYCDYVERELAEFYHTIECKIDDNDTNVTNVVAKNVGKLLSLKRILKFDDDTGKPLSNDHLDILKSTKDVGFVGYMVNRDTLLLVKKETGSWTKDFSQNLKKIQEKFRGIKVKVISIAIQALVSGSKIYSYDHEVSGSLGMFANIYENEKLVQVCTSSAHVLKKGQIAYFDNGGKTFELGVCIWPERESKFDLITQVCVIKLNEDAKVLIKRRFVEPMKLYRGEIKELIHRKVFKFGAQSDLTYGYIQNKIDTFNDRKLIVVEPQSSLMPFSVAGDSGSIVLTKMYEQNIALGSVCGGFQSFDEFDIFSGDSTVAVSLSEAMDEFETNHRSNIKIVDYFM